MSDIEVRSFRRADREQLTALVNAHAQAVVPGVSASVNTVLSQLEREPNEFLVEPWVAERATLVAEQRGRVSAAAYLVRYGPGPEVGAALRGTGEIRWLLCWPDAAFWPDSMAAGAAVTAAAVAVLRHRGVAGIGAELSLPAPGVYGVPAQWPHVARLLLDAGFAPGDRTETVLLADVAGLPRPVARPDLVATRTVAALGTRFTAVRDGRPVGHLDVDAGIGGGGRLTGPDRWADVGHLEVAAAHRRQGIGTWLLGQAADWLRLGRTDRLLAYTEPAETALLACLESAGFHRLTETRRGWRAP